jgi:hypothetical protein
MHVVHSTTFTTIPKCETKWIFLKLTAYCRAPILPRLLVVTFFSEIDLKNELSDPVKR